jgi:hypothetical protein
MWLPKKLKEDLPLHQANLYSAKVKQEEAIAERIRTSEEVLIEEYYDSNDMGSIGVDVKQTGMNAGLNAKNQRISKRIYRFSGNDRTIVDTS